MVKLWLLQGKPVFDPVFCTRDGGNGEEGLVARIL